MTTRIAAEQERLTRLVEEMQQALDLQWVYLRLSFKNRTEDGDDRVAAICQADWEYRQAGITFLLPNTMPMDDDELRLTILHELVHVLNASVESVVPNGDVKHKCKEYAAENVAKALWALWKKAHG